MNRRSSGLQLSKALVGFLQYKAAKGLSLNTLRNYEDHLNRSLSGSSSTSTWGFIANVAAMARSCFWPAESREVMASRQPSMPSSSSVSSRRAPISGRGRQRFSSPKAISSSTVNGHPAKQAALDGVGDEPADGHQQRALAAPRGAAQDHEFAPLHPQIDLDQGFSSGWIGEAGGG